MPERTLDDIKRDFAFRQAERKVSEGAIHKDGHPSDVQRHRVSDTPIQPHESIPDAWATWCKCGWGATCDSPEAAAMGLGWHLLKVGMDDVAISRAGYYLGVS